MAALALFLLEIVRFRVGYLVQAVRLGWINTRTRYISRFVPARSRAFQTDPANDVSRRAQPAMFWAALIRLIWSSLIMVGLSALLFYLVFILLKAAR